MMPLLFLRRKPSSSCLHASPCEALSSPSWSYTSVWPAQWYHCHVIPFGHFSIQLAFLLVEYLHLFSYFCLLLLSSCAMMACVGYRKGMTNDDKRSTDRRSTLAPINSKPGPDKAGRLAPPFWKIPFSSPRRKKHRPVRSPNFLSPFPHTKNNQDPKGHARWQ